MHESQIFDMINIGIVVFDREFTVCQWNRWMAQQSGISREEIKGRCIFDHFPSLDNPKFHRNCKAVFSFGSFGFFSQKLHKYLFPFLPAGHLRSELDYMQQSCTLGPLYDDNRKINHLFISVEDVTEAVLYQNRLTELNRRDSLTGLFNRRYLAQSLTREFERAQRYKRPLTLMMLDIDYFKRINDTFGHQFGDEVIRLVANLLVQELRNVDVAARYGGEEFCCFLPETEMASCVSVAERLRSKVSNLNLCYGEEKTSVTISVGVSEVKAEMDNYEALLRMADEALYLAKKNGRNQVCVSP